MPLVEAELEQAQVIPLLQVPAEPERFVGRLGVTEGQMAEDVQQERLAAVQEEPLLLMEPVEQEEVYQVAVEQQVLVVVSLVKLVH